MKRIFNSIKRCLRGRKNSRRSRQQLPSLQPRGEQLEARQLLSADFAPWHNYALPEDVNADGNVNLLDSLLVHRELAAAGSTPIEFRSAQSGSPLTPAGEGGDQLFPDVNADNQLTADDAQRITDFLAPPPAAEGDGELAFYDLTIKRFSTGVTEGAGEIEGTVELGEGERFWLQVWAHDTRIDGTLPAAKGIARGFVNINYPSNWFDVTGPIDHDTAYTFETGGDASLDGIIDTTGGTQTDLQNLPDPLGLNPVLLFEAPMVAETTGTNLLIASLSPPNLDEFLPNGDPNPRWEDYTTILYNPTPSPTLDPTTVLFDSIFINVVTPAALGVDDPFDGSSPQYATVLEGSAAVPLDVLANDLIQDPTDPAHLIVSSPGDFVITGLNDTPGLLTYTTSNGGTVAVNGTFSAINYTPPPGDWISGTAPDFLENGPDAFRYLAEVVAGPNAGFEISGNVEVTVENADEDAPVAVNDPDAGNLADPRFQTPADTPLVIAVDALLENDIDPDFDATEFVTAREIPGTTDGVVDPLSQAPNAVVYDPTGVAAFLALGDGQFGVDQFEYEIRDADAPGPLTDTATVTVTIVGVNDPPTIPAIFQPITDTVDDNDTGRLFDLTTFGITDPDNGDSVVYPNGIFFSPTTDALIQTNGVGSVLYVADGTPSLDALSPGDPPIVDTFTLPVTDQNGGVLNVQFEITVTGADDPIASGAVPQQAAFSDKTSTFYADLPPAAGTPNVLENFSDPDSGVIVNFQGSTTGTSDKGAAVSIVNGVITYDPTTSPTLSALVYPNEIDDVVTITVTSDTNPADTYEVDIPIKVSVDISMPDIGGSVIYADVNQNGKHDRWEKSISGVTILLSGKDIFGDLVNLSAKTDANGGFLFDNLIRSDAAGYKLEEIQPQHIVEGILPGVDENIYTIRTQADANRDFIFGEIGLMPRFIHPQDYLASTRSTGIVFGLDPSGNQLWYSLQDGWNGVTRIQSARLNAAGTRLTFDVVENGITTTISVNTINNRDFFHRGTSRQGSVVQIYGDRGDFGI